MIPAKEAPTNLEYGQTPYHLCVCVCVYATHIHSLCLELCLQRKLVAAIITAPLTLLSDMNTRYLPCRCLSSRSGTYAYSKTD